MIVLPFTPFSVHSLVHHDPQRNLPQRASCDLSAQILDSDLCHAKFFWTPFLQLIRMMRRVRDFPLVSRVLGRFLISPPFLSRVRTESGRVANRSPTTFNGLVPPSTVSNKIVQSRVGQRSLEWPRLERVTRVKIVNRARRRTRETTSTRGIAEEAYEKEGLVQFSGHSATSTKPRLYMFGVQPVFHLRRRSQ